MDHSTGLGRVEEHKGHYHDGIYNKGNTVLLLISEVLGSVNGTAARYLARLAHRARDTSDTVYFERGGRAISFYEHYGRRISRAAAVGHGKTLLKLAAAVNVRAGKERAAALARAAAAEAAAELTGDAPATPRGHRFDAACAAAAERARESPGALRRASNFLNQLAAESGQRGE